MARSAIRRRYLSLGFGELAATAALGAYWYLQLWTDGDTSPVEPALALLMVLLLQGSAYWLLALRWIPGGRMGAGVATCYRTLRLLDLALIAGIAGWICWLAARTGPAVTVAAGLLWLFAVAEYVNYFWIRLSYPVLQWPARVRAWRRSRLAVDLDRARP